MKFSKLIPYIAAAIILLIAGFYFLPKEIPPATPALSTGSSTVATPTVPNATPTQATQTRGPSDIATTSTTSAPQPATTSSVYTIPVTSSESVLAAMQQYASSSDFTFTDHEEAGLGFFVDSFEGRANAAGSYWFLYINGASSQLGASSALVHPGDVVEWRYEKSY